MASHGRLVGLWLLICAVRLDAWSFTGDIINSDNSFFNLGLSNEGSGEGNEVNLVKDAASTAVNINEDGQSEWKQGAAKTAGPGDDTGDFNEEDKRVSGVTGQKYQCASGVDSCTCSCNFTQIIFEYGDLLRGPKGDMGPRGPAGPIGLPGPPGLPGLPVIASFDRRNMFESDSAFIDPSITYMTGRIGEPGPPGPRGLPGHKGEKGEPGIGIKGDPGERGKRGKTGKPGVRGLPGPPGLSGLPGAKGDSVKLSEIKRVVMENGIKGAKGEPGPPGPPGPPAPVIYENWPESSLRSRHYRAKNSGDESGLYTICKAGEAHVVLRLTFSAGSQSKVADLTLVFNTIDELQAATQSNREGTLAFVSSEQALMIRIKSGWQYVSLGRILTAPENVLLEKVTIDGTTAEPPSGDTDLNSALDFGRIIPHERKLRLAALNQPFSGDMHGVRGADYECFRQSRRANLKGTFRALVASRVQNLQSIVRHKDSKLPVVNLKDEILFNSWHDIFAGSGAPFPYPPKIYSFDGRNILTDSTWPQKLMWHGADKNGVRNTDAYCEGWGSSSMSRMGVASNLLRGKLLDQEQYSCNNAFAVLCIEVSTEQGTGRHRRDDRH